MILLGGELMRNTFDVGTVLVHEHVRTIPRIFRKTAYFYTFYRICWQNFEIYPFSK